MPYQVTEVRIEPFFWNFAENKKQAKRVTATFWMQLKFENAEI